METDSKDFKVYEFRSRNTRIVRTLDTNTGLYLSERNMNENPPPEPEWNEEFFLCGAWDILSVIRLSDHKVFKIGDELRFTGRPPNPRKIIEKFSTKGNKLLVHWTDDDEYTAGYYLTIFNHYDHTFPYLFKTDDGKFVYKGDKYWAIYQTGKNQYVIITETAGDYNPEYAKRFKSKENAEAWVDLHKLQYSKDHIWEAIKECPSIFHKGSWRIEEEELKKRLNL